MILVPHVVMKILSSINIMVKKLCVFRIYIWNGSDNVCQIEEIYQKYLLSKLVILFTKY